MDSKTTNSPPPLPAVPLLDVGRGNHPLEQEVLDAIRDVCESGRFLHGPACRELERQIAALTKVDHAVSCASGSDALLLAMMALDIGPGDEVIVPSFTFFATASAVWRLGATPVFADIDPASMTLRPQDVQDAVTPATRAIIPVHLFGQCADMIQINEIAQTHGLKVVEDSAQAIGAEFRQRPAGSWGDMSCISFYPTKNLGGFGDGGMLTTWNSEFADRLQLLAGHGMRPRYYHAEVGINSRLDTVQAAVLLVKLAHLEVATGRRRENAARYAELFAERGLDQVFQLPQEGEGQRHVWNQYTIRVPNSQRDALRQHLANAGVGSEIYYPVPLHRQQCFAEIGFRRSLPETDRAAGEVLSLPIFPELTDEELQTVVMRMDEFAAQARLAAA